MSLLQGLFIPLFASAGGGGSGGGGDGGGVVMLVGYLPMHFLGAFFRKRKLEKIGNFVTWPVAVVYSVLLIGVFRSLGFIIAIGALVGAGAGLYGWWGKLRRNKKVEAGLRDAATKDSAWNPESLMQYTEKVIERFQYDWSRSDTESMKQYLTPWYHYHVSLMMAVLAQARRVNRMSEVKILEQHIQSVTDAADNSLDCFVVGFEMSAVDELVDSRNGQVIFTNTQPVIEYWNFRRNDNTWLLDGITPHTADLNSQNQQVKQFAEENKFCYSLDWGWLLLPQYGQLFGSAKFGVADINNHVIGQYQNVIIQIYTYTPSPTNRGKDNYLVAQVQLPKSYGEILVRRKKGMNINIFGSRVKGLQKIETEWGDFNKKYEVFASTAEGPTSFELLHPVFMEVLERQPFEVNLEVVDNTVYFYTKQTTLQPAYYSAFLEILREAFKQMRM